LRPAPARKGWCCSNSVQVIMSRTLSVYRWHLVSAIPA